VFDGRQPPTWPLGITLNTFLAFFTSLAKLAFMIPITEGLGQLRWLWFTSRPRPLNDFEAIDQASRGAFGSLRLLAKFKGGYGIFSCIIIYILIRIESLVVSALPLQ
jgi:hypothetical protein